MPHLRSIKELWSETEPEQPCLIMGNSESVRMFPEEVHDRFFTIGCNTRLHPFYIPDLTLMVDPNIPTPRDADCSIATHLPKWKQQHQGTVYEYRLGRRLQFHPDTSNDKIDYSITSAYMAFVLAFHMGYRTISFVGLDLGAVNGRDRMDSESSGVTDARSKFFGGCYNHLSHLINRMGRYHRCRFFSMSPHSQLLQNGYVQRMEVPTHGRL